MSANKTELRALLDDVLPLSGEHCGPTRTSILEIVRRERLRRRCVRLGVTATTVLALTIFGVWWHLPVSSQGPVASVPQPPPLVVKTVSDEQLPAVLEGTPAALIEWPNGERTLLVVREREAQGRIQTP